MIRKFYFPKKDGIFEVNEQFVVPTLTSILEVKKFESWCMANET